MIIRKRPSEDRGKAENGWLRARFTFSFSDYRDEAHNRFHSLIVMNNDIIEPGGGFAMHPHENAEIFTYVMSGQLQHKDSMGNGSVIEAGDLQYMSAGVGVRHSEFNPSTEEKTELYQVWMEPRERGGDPIYSDKKLGQGSVSNELKLLFSGNGREESTEIRQDAEFFFGQLDQARAIVLRPEPGLPHVWIQVVSGKLQVDQTQLDQADGLAIEEMDQALELRAKECCAFFVFRLPQEKN